MTDLISQLSEFTVQTKRLLNTYPYEVRMNKGAVVEFSDKYCAFTSPYKAEDSLLGIPIVQSSVVPDQEAWIMYHDDTAPGGFRREVLKWG